MLDTGCWILDAGYWMLDTGCWILDAGYWMLDTGCWIPDADAGSVSLEFGSRFMATDF